MLLKLSSLVCYSFTVIMLLSSFLGMVRWSLSQWTTMRFNIVNSYSGSLSLYSYSGLIINVAGITWIDRANISLQISSSTGVQYVIAGDIVWWVTGSLVSSLTVPILLSWEDWRKVVRGWFLAWGEPLVLESLILWLDRQAPTMPLLTGIFNNTTIASGLQIPLTREPSVDTGVWLLWYQVYIWLVPDISYMVSYITTGTSLILPSSSAPYGTLYWTVVAIDYLWHRTQSMMWYFHHGYPTLLNSASGYQPQASSTSVSIISQTQSSPSLWSQYSIDSKDTWVENKPKLPISLQSVYPNANPVYYLDQWLYKNKIIWIDCGVWNNGRLLDINCKEWDHDIMTQLIDLSQGFIKSSIISTWVLLWSAKDWNKPVINWYSILDSNWVHNSADIMIWRFLDKPIVGWSLPKWQNTSAWNQYCEKYNYCFDPDNIINPNPRQYENILHQYSQNYISHTRIITWYAILITMSLIMISIWFFIFWYHHHYIIKYLKH